MKATRKKEKEQAIRAIISDAVATVVSQRGAANVSIERIAREAGLSKGGVFYYYPSKDALMLSLLERYRKHFRERQEKLLKSLPDTRDRHVRATFAALFEDINYATGDRLYLAEMLAVPEFRERLSGLKIKLLEDLRRGLKNPENVTLAYIMFDGMWIDMLLKPEPVFSRESDFIKQKAWELLDALEYEDEEESSDKNPEDIQ